MTAKKEAKEARRARLATAGAAAADCLDPGEPASKGPGLSGISRRQALAALALVLLVTVSFFPAYLAEFVWDDFVLTEDPFGEKRLGLSTIWGSPREMEYEGHYWPVVYTTFWLEHKLWGPDSRQGPPSHAAVLRDRSGHRLRGYGLLPDPRGPLPGLLAGRANPDRGPGALVLRRQVAVAHRSGRHLPVVGDRSPRPPRLGARRARRGAAGDGNAAAHANMGITLFNLGRYEEAARSLERSLALDPEQPTAQGALEEARRRARAGEP